MELRCFLYNYLSSLLFLQSSKACFFIRLCCFFPVAVYGISSVKAQKRGLLQIESSGLFMQKSFISSMVKVLSFGIIQATAACPRTLSGMEVTMQSETLSLMNQFPQKNLQSRLILFKEITTKMYLKSFGITLIITILRVFFIRQQKIKINRCLLLPFRFCGLECR